MAGVLTIEKTQLQATGVFVAVLLAHLAVAAAILMARADHVLLAVDSAPIFEMVDLTAADVKPSVAPAPVVIETPTPLVKVAVTPPRHTFPDPSLNPSQQTVARPPAPLPVATDDALALSAPAPTPTVANVVTSAEPMMAQEAAPLVATPSKSPSRSGTVISNAVSAQPAPESPVDDFVSPDLEAAYRTNPPPPYPLMARRRGLAGVVILRVTLDENGRPQHVTVKESSGHSILDETAVQSVRKWNFVPAQRGGRSVEAEVDVPLRFALR